jgi:hypothetical protein
MAISSKDIETLWKRYSSEAVNRGVSVAQFFESNGVPYHVFEKWYKKKFTQPAVVNCVVKETQDVASQPSKDNIAETDAAVGAADHEEKNISYVYVGLNVRYSTHGYANPIRDAAGTRGIIGTGW